MASTLKSKLVICNVPTQDSEASRRFYGALLGTDEFVRAPDKDVETYTRPILADGVDLAITQRFEDTESMTCYFAVENLERATKELEERGGELKYESSEITRDDGETIGRFAVVLDPDKNHVGLIELSESAQKYFRFGEYGEPLRPEQLEGLRR
jgi:predicted enzyme related to lactoylglutathione lyase